MYAFYYLSTSLEDKGMFMNHVFFWKYHDRHSTDSSVFKGTRLALLRLLV